MAATITKTDERIGPGEWLVTYSIVAAGGGDTGAGEAFEMPGAIDRVTIQKTATAALYTLDIEASNDGTTFRALPTAIQFTSSAAERSRLVHGNRGFRYYRPNLSAVLAANTLTVKFILSLRDGGRGA